MKTDESYKGDSEATLVGEVLLFGLLGKALYEEPDRKWLDGLIAERVFADVPFGAEQPQVVQGLEILQQWSQDMASGISNQCFNDLKIDFTRLFIGLDTLPTAPWESVYFNRERLVFQEQTLQVREWYSRFGLQIERLNREPDDHIGLELSFMAHLASLALHALSEDDNQKFEDILQAQRDFLSQHLLRWGPAWARLVIEHAHTGYYRGLAHLTHGAFLAVVEHLKIELPKEVSL